VFWCLNHTDGACHPNIQRLKPFENKDQNAHPVTGFLHRNELARIGIPDGVSTKSSTGANPSLGIHAARKVHGLSFNLPRKSCPAQCHMCPASGLLLGKGLDLVPP
jgi:hypothetical protein